MRFAKSCSSQRASKPACRPAAVSDSPMHAASRCSLSHSCRARALRSTRLLPTSAAGPSSCCSVLHSLKSVAARALPARLALAAVPGGSAPDRLLLDLPEPPGVAVAVPSASCLMSSLLHLKRTAQRSEAACRVVAAPCRHKAASSSQRELLADRHPCLHSRKKHFHEHETTVRLFSLDLAPAATW